MSFETAQLVSVIANWALLASLLVGVISTFAVIKAGDVKEEHFRKGIAESSAVAATANQAAAEANERAAEANKAAESEKLERLKLEARLAPRRINQQQQMDLTTKLAPFKKLDGTIIASPSTPEAEWLARTLGAPLIAAGWKMEILPGTATATVLYPGGVVIHYDATGAKTVQEAEMTETGRAARALAKSLDDIGIQATAIGLPPGPFFPAKDIQIVIAPK